MSSGSSLWRLYPKRSIASHRICGSGRLFPGLERETRRAESMTRLVTELVVAKDNEQSRTLARIFRACPDVKRILQNVQQSQDSWAKSAGIMGQTGKQSAKYASRFGQPANAPVPFLVLKRRCPPAARSTLPTTRFTASGQASADSWHRQSARKHFDRWVKDPDPALDRLVEPELCCPEIDFTFAQTPLPRS